MAENKSKFWKRRRKIISKDINKLIALTVDTYNNKYYNLWMSKFEWNGLDEDLKEQEENYIMRKLWYDGTVAIRNIKNTNMIAIAPWELQNYNYLGFPETINLINERGASKTIIPSKTLIVNKDVALLFCTPSQKPIKAVVDYYVDRITQAVVLINNNLCLQNMPFVINCTEEDQKRLSDIVDRILNNELVITTASSDINKLQALITQVPFLIDKLQAYIVSMENELLTILGVDNSGVQAKKAQMLVDEVNANNDVINDYGRSIEDEIRGWLERANKVLNKNISIEVKSKPVDSTKDYEDKSIQDDKERAGQ